MISIDQSEDKQYCLDLLEQLELDSDDPRYNVAAEIVLSKIMGKAKHWNVDATKLQALLRSQLFSGYIQGASKIISEVIPDRRVNLRGPYTVAAAAIEAAILYIRSIIR